MASKTKGRITIDQERCKGCQVCMAFCPKGSIVLADTLNAAGYQPVEFTDDGECTGCAICALVCADVVIEVYRD